MTLFSLRQKCENEKFTEIIYKPFGLVAVHGHLQQLINVKHSTTDQPLEQMIAFLHNNDGRTSNL